MDDPVIVVEVLGSGMGGGVGRKEGGLALRSSLGPRALLIRPRVAVVVLLAVGPVLKESLIFSFIEKA